MNSRRVRNEGSVKSTVARSRAPTQDYFPAPSSVPREEPAIVGRSSNRAPVTLSSRAIAPERDRKWAAITGHEHDSALRRLTAALEEQDRSSERYDAAIGTSTELRAYIALCAAGEQVTARAAWLNWVDDERYRGLDAGPFSRLAETPETARVRE